MKMIGENSSELRAYIAGLREEENRNKLIGLIVIGSVIIALLATAVVYLLKKKSEEEYFDDWDEEWDDDDECCCEDDCCTCEECASSSHSLKSAVNSIVDGVMGGVVVAADKLSELSNKLADFVSEKLDERKENSTPAFKFDWSEDDESQECSGCQEGEDSCECAKEASAGDSDSALGADSGSDGDING